MATKPIKSQGNSLVVVVTDLCKQIGAKEGDIVEIRMRGAYESSDGHRSFKGAINISDISDRTAERES